MCKKLLFDNCANFKNINISIDINTTRKCIYVQFNVKKTQSGKASLKTKNVMHN